MRFNVLLHRDYGRGMTIDVKTLRGEAVPLVKLATDDQMPAQPEATTQTLEGTREFYLEAAGMGGEKIKITLFDAAGNVAHTQDPVSLASQFVVTRPAHAPAEVWSARTERAQGFYLEDHSLDLYGVPPIMATDPDALLMPTPRH